MPSRFALIAVAGLSSAALAVGSTATQFGVAATAGAQSQSPGGSGSSAKARYEVKPIFTPKGLSTHKGFPLNKPDDIVRMGGDLFVAFQNGVGSNGEPAPKGNPDSGNTESSLLQLTRSGGLVRQWDLTGKIDGLGVDPATKSVVATVNEDGNSSIYTVDPSAPGSGTTHYCYNKRLLPHGGGTDDVSFHDGKLIVSASNPSAADGPAVYAARLEPHVHPTNCPAGTAHATGTAVLTNGFSDSSTATPADPGAPSKLALTDPDSSTVVPGSAPRFGGSFMLDSQGDDEQIYTNDPVAASPHLNVLQLSRSVDDTAFVTSKDGALYATDPSNNSLDRIRGPFQVGQAFVAVTPCNDNKAPQPPSPCPAKGFPANSLGQLDMTNGHVTSVSTALQPVGMIFAPSGNDQGGQLQNQQ